jgi:integrase
MPARPLSASEVAALDKPGVHRVDRGLYLQIRPRPSASDPDAGVRSWLLRYQINKRTRWMGLGSASQLSLTQARRKAFKLQQLIVDGIDPLAAKQAEKKAAAKVPTFAECAEAYVEAHRAGWRNPKHVAQWESTLKTYAAPVIGDLPVSDVTVDHVVRILQPIWTAKPETAGRLRGRIERVLDWARARGYREGDNPARWQGALSHLLPPLSRVQTIKHHDAVPYAEVPALVAELRSRPSTSAQALAFTVLTAARTGEVIGATWSEIDLDAAVWTIPAQRMKAGRAHRVPLSDAAVALLRSLPRAGEFVFTGARAGRPLSNMAMLQLVRGIRGQGATVHGLRSSFRDWAAERTSFPREVVEAALAHVVGDRTEAAYLRTEFIEQRRQLMQAWADHCAGR